MKKLISILFLLSVAFALISCGDKKDDGGTKSEGAAVSGEKSSAQKKSKKLLPSRIIYSGWVLYEERSDGKMYAVEQAVNGDAVKLYAEDDDNPEQKKAVRRLQSGEEDEFNFVRVNYEGKDYWTRDIFVSPANSGELYVAMEDVLAYSKPDGISITSTTVKEGSAVAAKKNAKQDGYVQCIIYNGNPFGREIYLNEESLCDYENALQILNAIKLMEEIASDSSNTNEKNIAETSAVLSEITSAILNLNFNLNDEKQQKVYSWITGKIAASDAVKVLLIEDVLKLPLFAEYESAEQIENSDSSDSDAEDFFEGE